MNEILDMILSEEELEDLGDDGLIDYLNNLNNTIYLTGWYNLGDHLNEISEALENEFSTVGDEEYLVYIKYILERNDVFILDDYELDDSKYPKAKMVAEYTVENSYGDIIYKDKFDDIYYYDYNNIINAYINEVMEIPSHLEDYIDYDSIIRSYKIDDCFYITGDDGNYEMLDVSALR